ncbi:MAG: hypothetical protein HC897_00685 [Thermoanaerobaculia bacterium]|nr:hypothetical protein [Thermoanaerobaculia bacterium]
MATFDELRSQLLRVQGCGAGALELLEKAAHQLETPGLEGRRAEVLGRRGVLLLQQGDATGALKTLEEALGALPMGQSPGLRLYLLHNSAATLARLGRVEAAAARLDEAEPLYETHGYDFLRAQRHWIRGLVQMKASQPEAAETSLRTAIEQLLALRFGRSAVLALFDLARLYAVAGWEHRFDDMDALFEELLKRPAFRSLLRVHGSELIGLARRKGVAVPHLQELMEKLERDGDPPSC